MNNFADAATGAGAVVGRIVGAIIVYFIIYWVIRLVTKHTPTKNQKIIAGVAAVVLLLASIAANGGQ